MVGGVDSPSVPVADVFDEARRVLAAGAELPLKLIGGVAVALAAGQEPLLPREYGDLDFATMRGRGPEAAALLERLGYRGDRRFNGLHGHRRLLFFDEVHERKLDVFVGHFEMCHHLPISERLALGAETLPLADLLLTKLQVVALNEKDERDIINLLYHHKLDREQGIDAGYVARLCAGDWGLWKTVTLNLERTRTDVARYGLTAEQEELIRSRIDDLRRGIDEEPKGARWRLRARVGERVKWYEEPEEVG